MNWYGSDTANDAEVPNGQSQWGRFPSQERWKQWGENTATSFDSPHKLGNGAADEADFSCESLMDEVQMDCLICPKDEAEMSYAQVQGVSEESSRYWTTLLNNQDYQPNGVQGTDQTAENFMYQNSLLVDYAHGSEHFHFSMGNNLTSDSSSDLYNMHDMSSYEHLNAEDFPCSLDWENQHSDSPYYNHSDTMTTRVGDQLSVEETVLQEFGSAMRKMTDVSRLCFRDALYRLASNSKNYSSNQSRHEDNLTFPFTTELPDQTLRSTERGACESKTNTIDRTIADLMFNKAHTNDNSHQQLFSTAKPFTGNPLKSSLAPHFQHFTGSTQEDAVVPTLGQGEPLYSEY